MLSEGFYRIYQAPKCEFGLLGLGVYAGRALKPLCGARGRSGVSLSFLCGPHASFSFGRRLQEEPPSLRTEREGDQEFPYIFCATLAHPFRSEGGVVCRALECEPGSLGLGMVAGRPPEPPHGAKGRSGVSLSFLCDPRASFSLERRGGICQATLGGRER